MRFSFTLLALAFSLAAGCRDQAEPQGSRTQRDERTSTPPMDATETRGVSEAEDADRLVGEYLTRYRAFFAKLETDSNHAHDLAGPVIRGADRSQESMRRACDYVVTLLRQVTQRHAADPTPHHLSDAAFHAYQLALSERASREGTDSPQHELLNQVATYVGLRHLEHAAIEGLQQVARDLACDTKGTPRE